MSTICVQTHHERFEQVATRLPTEMQQALDAVLQVQTGESQSALAALQQYPPKATPTAIKAYLDRSHRVRELGVDQLDLCDIRPGGIEHLARLTRRYDVHTWRRFPAARHHAGRVPLRCG